MKKPFVIVVVGPTAVGKSEYAVALAKKMKGEIISADSRQIYRGLDIGSGKITKKEMENIQHYMIDVASPKFLYSAHRFKKTASPILKSILKNGKTPIIVGGTGFYIDALLDETILPNVPPNKKLRKELSEFDAENLFKILQKLDEERSMTIDAKNKVRLVRAIEIATELGKVPKIEKKPLPYEVLWIGLTADRKLLKEKITLRTKKQLTDGMVLEVKKLHEEGVSWKRLNELGLEQRLCVSYLKSEINAGELEKKLIEKVYQYAMCQFTWFKRNQKIGWIEIKK